MRVVDGFTFNDELDLLELRFMELYDVVDAFVIVELPVNFRQQPKPLHYLDNRERFDRWNDKVIHIIPDTFPVGPHPTIEWFQRRQIALGFDLLAPDDLVMMGDVDEIPNRDVILLLKDRPRSHPILMLQYLYYHKVNLRVDTPWAGTVIMPRGTAAVKDLDMQKVRNDRGFFPPIVRGGWHFSWLGDGAAIEKKMCDIDVERDMALFPPTEAMTVNRDPAFLAEVAQGSKDLFGRSDPARQKQRVPLTPGENQPYAISDWLTRHVEYAL